MNYGILANSADWTARAVTVKGRPLDRDSEAMEVTVLYDAVSTAVLRDTSVTINTARADISIAFYDALRNCTGEAFALGRVNARAFYAELMEKVR